MEDKMNRKRAIYVLLMACLVIAIGLSFYFYKKAQVDRLEITKATEPDNLPSYHFALIGEEMDHDYWRLVGEGAKDAEKKYDVFVEYEGPRRSNPEEQLKLLDQAIKAKVDGIIVQALTEDFLPMINKAVNQGIPVITIDTDAPESLRTTYIGTDNYLAGQIAGKTLVEDKKGQATVGIITGSFTNAHHQLRVEGFKNVVADIEGVEIVEIEESNITQVIAEEKTYEMLKNHPEIDALYGTSALDGIGMVHAAESLNRSSSIYMISFDTLPENMELLEQGKVDVLIGQKPYEMGYRSIELMLDIVKGRSVEEVNHTDATVVSQKNLDNFIPQERDEP